MAQNFDCMISMFCAEHTRGSEWEDKAGNYSEQQGQGEADPLRQSELPAEDDEVIELLIQKEASLLPQEYTDSYEGRNADLRSREEAVSWMLDVHAYYRFSQLAAFLSVSYFDRFVSKHQISRGKAWLLQLLAVGCVSLAAKLEETEVPLLLDLQVGQVQHVFEARTIQRMELLILSTLNWQMSSVTPYSYVNYLLHKIGICKRSSSGLVSRVEEMILNTCRVFRFLVYSPSVIAVASVICACDELLPFQAASFKRALLSLWPVREKMTVECAALMQELLVDPFWTSNKVVSWPPQSPIGVLDTACFSCDSDHTIASTTRSVNALSGTTTPSINNANNAIVTAATTAAPPSPSPPPQHPNPIDVSRKRKFHERYSIVKPTADSATPDDREP